MGRIFFLSAVALLAYKYIARSNQKHQPLDAPGQAKDLLPSAAPPPPVITASTRSLAAETDAQPKLVAAGSRAVEPDPGR